MNTVSASELIRAGVAFTMVNEDAAFGDDGELLGYREVGRERDGDPEAELHAARLLLEAGAEGEAADELEVIVSSLSWADGDFRNRYNSTSEGVTDTTEMTTPYWDEVANSHLAEMRNEWRLSKPQAKDLEPLHGTMEFWAKQREERFDRLRRMAKRLAKQRNFTKLQALKQGVVARYGESAKLIAERGKAEWFLLYLTSAQVSYLRGV